jgi:hypothetical protein
MRYFLKKTQEMDVGKRTCQSTAFIVWNSHKSEHKYPLRGYEDWGWKARLTHSSVSRIHVAGFNMVRI